MEIIRRRDPERRMARFYAVQVQWALGLSGDHAHLIREWGRIGSPGTIRVEAFASAAEAEGRGAAIAAAKRRRGYR